MRLSLSARLFATTLFATTLLATTLFAAPVYAQRDWSLRRDQEGIRVYTAEVAGSPYAAVKTVALVEDVRISSMVALLEDVGHCSQWADKCAESFVLRRVTATESYIYTHNDLPFPIKDRDYLAHVYWSQDPETLQVQMDSTATTGIMALRPDRLRLTESSKLWQFTPQPNGAVEISMQAHINPGSILPGWASNMLLVDTPFQTIRSFIAEVRKAQYRDATVQFIEEPDSLPGRTPGIAGSALD